METSQQNRSMQAGADVADAQLLAYLDGALNAEEQAALEERLRQDNGVHNRLLILAREQRALTDALRHVHAPTVHLLGEYALGLCSPDEARAIEAQIEQYPHLAYEVNRLRYDLAQIGPNGEESPSPTRTIRSFVAKLRPTGLGGLAAGLRGDVDTSHRHYEVNGLQIILEFQPEDGDSNMAATQSTPYTMLGLVLPGGASSYTVQPITAQLFKGDYLVAETDIDAAGNFILPHLAPAVYDLVVSDSQTDFLVNELVPSS